MLEALISVLSLRNNWAILHSLLKFTAFYWKTSHTNSKGILIIFWSPNTSSINNLLQQKLYAQIIARKPVQTLWMPNAWSHSL